MFIATFLKFFFLTTPFFVLSMFLSMTADLTQEERKRVANRVIIAAWVIMMVMFLCGQVILTAFSISVDAFRVGGGALLFLSAVALMNPKVNPENRRIGPDIAIVPLAMPIIIGPATCALLLVMGAEIGSIKNRIIAISAMSSALFTLWIILRMAAWFEKHIGPKGLSSLMRLTGLILSAISAQMIMTGVMSFFKNS